MRQQQNIRIRTKEIEKLYFSQICSQVFSVKARTEWSALDRRRGIKDSTVEKVTPQHELFLCSVSSSVSLDVWVCDSSTPWWEKHRHINAIQTCKVTEHMGDGDNFVARRDNCCCEHNASLIQYSSGWVRPKHTIVSILFLWGDKFLIAYGTYYSTAGSNREQNNRKKGTA